MTLPELALRFILQHPAVTTTIPGMRRLANVRANCAVSDGVPLAPALREQLRAHRWERDWVSSVRMISGTVFAGDAPGYDVVSLPQTRPALLDADAARLARRSRHRMGSRALSHALSGVLGSARTARALRRNRRQPVAHDDHARRPHLGRGGRRDLSRRRRLGPQLRGARNQPRQRRLRPAGGVAVAVVDFPDRVGLGRHDDGRRPATRRPGHGRKAGRRWRGCHGPASGRSIPGPPSRLPPRSGEAWRFNVFRIKRPGGQARPQDGAVLAAWSKPSGPSFHDPAAFRPLSFR